MTSHDLQRNRFILRRPVRPLQDVTGIQQRETTLLRVLRVDVRTRIAEALSDVDKSASAQHQQILTSDMPEPLWVDGDAARLRQALANLLENAVSFTEPGGRIHVSAWRNEQHVIVRISDTGRALDTNEFGRMFELLSQARPGEDPGLEIGLNAAWDIIALHRGRIDVRRDSPSRGREFTVTLPSTAERE